ncbi:30S ribosome-binding factor RbfA [Alphaproteobacteria bacterium]|jgi:ribosome-binding factor A|nr:30S ribosome-binding factor RbfA [SAR116 cluster bacterium]MDA9929882.1 30S ribosome-binding factor RbfA [Alphaproteobacteria bacterium]NCF49413.1 30S ribosome-binding factor RbfA [Bacteroidota bacterium]
MAGKSRRSMSANLPSQRQLRVGETLRHALSVILSRDNFFDPDLENVPITISEISVSPDLSNARVYTMPLGGEKSETVLPALNRLAPLLQKEIASKVHLRRVPKLKFYLDDSFDNAARLNVVFNTIRRDD